MPGSAINPLLFVFPPESISETLVRTCGQAQAEALFDLSAADHLALADGLRQAGASQVKLSLEQFLGHSLGPFLVRSGVGGVWVEYHPAFHGNLRDEFLEALREWSPALDCRPVVGDPEAWQWLADHMDHPRCLALKGSEAAGLAGPEPVAMLFSQWEAWPAAQAPRPGAVIWGGVATAEAAAAFLASGAACIVFESLHWLTEGVALAPGLRRRLENMRLDYSTLVGGELGLACRVWDRGNSAAVRRLRQEAAAQAAGSEASQGRRELAHRLRENLQAIGQDETGPDKLIPLGPEAAFAAGFARRLGRETGPALRAFQSETIKRWQDALVQGASLEQALAAKELGLTYPFIQGAMSCISDRLDFARAVAQAGGLPTIALGLRDLAGLQADLGDLPRVMAGRPYAVNLLALPENPHLSQQMQWVARLRPPLVVLAAGDPSLVAELVGQGLRVAFLAPDEDLLRLALKNGASFVILEGHEAGGHVGAHSTLTMAQMALELRRQQPELFSAARLVLAGGISDRRSVWRAMQLGAEALQMGTAYLATSEIVETGALSPLYQRLVLEARPGQTRVIGTAAGLGVRSLDTPVIQSLASLEQEFTAGRLEEMDFRRRLETLCAGSLMVAARGVESPKGKPLGEAECLRRGQFMSGAVAGRLDRVLSLAELHRQLASGPLELTSPPTGRPRVPRLREIPPSQDGIVITGLAMANSLGNSLEDIWTGVLGLRSGVSEVPSRRFVLEEFYDPAPGRKGKTYCRVGAFLDLDISRQQLGLSPTDFKGMTESTRLTLWLAQQALADSGLLGAALDPERIGVVVSQNSGDAGNTLADLIINTLAPRLLRDLEGVTRFTAAQNQAALQALQRGRLEVDDTTLLGRLNSSAAGYICNRYGLQGPSFAVTAACASSLTALYLACQMVRSGVLDAALVGGGEELLTPMVYLEFSALMALAGSAGHGRPPAEWSRPFDAGRDGLVPGEGGAMVVIERQSVARGRGARVYAHLTGMGAGNSHEGMVEPLAGPQTRAMAASFRQAGYSPQGVGLVECHATATVLGDVEEVKALHSVFGPAGGVVLASFKSQIGHTLGAAGLSSLARGVMAMNAGVFPPTLNYQTPDPGIGLEEKGFRVLGEPEEWPRLEGRPRRMQVNAFGFGGANFVAQVQESLAGQDLIIVDASSPLRREDPARAGQETMPGLHFFLAELPAGLHRLAVEAASQDQARRLLASRLELLSSLQLEPRDIRALQREGIALAPAGQAPPPLALIFTGQGSYYPGMGKQLYQALPAIRRRMDRMAALSDYPLLDLMFDTGSQQLQRTRWQQPALYVLESALAGWLMDLGLAPQALAGHSLGEITAMGLAGVFHPEAGLGLVNQRAICMDQVSSDASDPGAMLATDAPRPDLEERIAGIGGLFMTNFNSPRQTVVGGPVPAVQALQAQLSAQGHRSTRLNVSMAFHSPAMRVIREPMARYLDGMSFQEPRIPVLSNTIGRLFPGDPVQIKAMVLNHLESPVFWVDELRCLWRDLGIRLFVEVGPRDSLCGMVADTLSEALTLHTCHPEGEVQTLRRAMAQLYVWGCLPAQGAENPLRLADLQSPSAGRQKAEEQKPQSAAGQPDQAGAAAQGTIADQGMLEDVIAIIMRATGYLREEIEPDLDLRRDLAIRSSRLPVIMDAAEKQFGIRINIQEFMDVRTVRDLANRVAQVAQRQGHGQAAPLWPSTGPLAPQATLLPETPPAPQGSRPPLRRFVLDDRPLAGPPGRPWQVRRSARALVLAAAGSRLGQAAQAALGARLGLRMDRLDLPGGNQDPSLGPILDRMAQGTPLTGLVIVLENEDEALTAGPPETAARLEDLFRVLKQFAASPEKAFCLALDAGLKDNSTAGLVAEGLAGMLLSASLEYPDLGLRALSLDDPAQLEPALEWAMDASHKAVRMFWRQGKAHAPEAMERPLALGEVSAWAPRAGDLVVVSGGARGVTASLARALAMQGCRLVLLGRSALDQSVDLAGLAASSLSAREAAAHWLRRKRPELKGDQLLSQESRLAAGVEITRSLRELSRLGADARYLPCDVTDPAAVADCLGRAVAPGGRIDGLVHGAGLLADSFMQMMTTQEFAKVLSVKLLGAWNLFRVAQPRGLRFMVGLGSVVAALGNFGQVNYSAANRAMACLLRNLGRENSLATKTLWLTALSGAGMADGQEMRDLMASRGLTGVYMSVGELAEFWARELAMAPQGQDWVMPARQIPESPNMLVRTLPEGPAPGDPSGPGGMAFSAPALPMVDEVRELDLEAGALLARRRLSLQRDLWLQDHRPLANQAPPVVSAVMAMETMLEGARLLYPYLVPQGLEQVEFLGFIECPPERETEMGIAARRWEASPGRVVCTLELSSPDSLASAEADQPWPLKARGRVLLGAKVSPPQPLAWHPQTELLPGPVIGPEEMAAYYARPPVMGHRYQVLTSVTALGPQAIRGLAGYRQGEDMAGQGMARYQYPPYLLEAMLHLINFHWSERQPQRRRLLFPLSLRELSWHGWPREGSEVVVEARRLHVSDMGQEWEGQILSPEGQVLLRAGGLQLFLKEV